MNDKKKHNLESLILKLNFELDFKKSVLDKTVTKKVNHENKAP